MDLDSVPTLRGECASAALFFRDSGPAHRFSDRRGCNGFWI